MNLLDSKREIILIFVGSFNDEYNQGFTLYQFDPEGKKIFLKNQTTKVINPIHFQFSKTNQFLYAACAQTPLHGTIASFEIDLQKADLSLISIQDSKGSIPCYVSIDEAEQFAFTANYNSGNIASFPLRDIGHLNPAKQSIQHIGQSIHPERQNEPHIHCIVTDPNNEFVFAVDLGTDEIISYRFNQKDGLLQSNPHSTEKFPPGAGPRHMIFHPNRTWVYVITELSNKVHCFDLSSDGKLIAKDSFNSLPETFNGESYAADIVIDPSGKYLYASNRGHDSISIFHISDHDGHLIFIGNVSSEGKFPWSLDIDVHGNFLMVANQHANNVVIFKRNSSNGFLSKYIEINDVESPVSARFILQPRNE